jgi:hypothetical protein
MADKYRINPNFVVPEPTAATFFCFWTADDYSDEARQKVLDGWRDEGVKLIRFTFINDVHPHDPYPHGFYLEGWTDQFARQLPFGEGGSPPLVAREAA